MHRVLLVVASVAAGSLPLATARGMQMFAAEVESGKGSMIGAASNNPGTGTCPPQRASQGRLPNWNVPAT